MNKKILIFALILYSMNLIAQKNLVDGCVKLKTNDSVCGKIENKNYSTARGVTLYNEKKHTFYSKTKIKEIYVNGEKYIKSENEMWSTRFFKKELSGSVNLYSARKNKYLGGFDSDLYIGNLKKSVLFYCTDFPNIEDSVLFLNKSNITEFVRKYNNWKENNPNSKSFFENNIHTKKLINIKLSFLLPGAGFELGLGDKFSLNSMLKNEFGYNSSSGWFINPFIDNQLRYYHNIDQRKRNNIRTYKYSGNYLCLVHTYYLNDFKSSVGLEYGWQRTVGKNWYYNLGFGAAKRIDTNIYSILCDFDFGFNF